MMNRNFNVYGTRRRGTVAVMVAVLMVTVLLFASLAVDVSYICALTGEMQSNGDASSLAGASAIQKGDYNKIMYWALDAMVQNQKAQGFHSPDDQIIEVGKWDESDASFTVMGLANANRANAVRVVSKRKDVPLYFAPIAGHSATTVEREAVSSVAMTCGGIWGLEEVKIPGSVVVDSFNYHDGPYSSGSTTGNGDVCSNGDLKIAGNAEVRGDVLGSPVKLAGSSLTITGEVDTLADPLPLPSIDFIDPATFNDNASIGLTDNGFDAFTDGNLYIPANDNLTLAPGTYFFGTLDFEKDATTVTGMLTLTGLTEIYVTGDVGATADAVINASQNTHNLVLYVGGTTVKLSGQSLFYGSILAPNAEVKFSGTGEFFGALIANSVNIFGDFQFHVDESLPLTHLMKPPPVLVK